MKRWMTTVVAVMMVAGAVRAADEATVDAARAAHQKYQKAAINIVGNLKITAEGALGGMMGGGQERPVEANATIIDSSGLAVASLMMLDPTVATKNMQVNVGGQRQNIQLKGELNDLKMRLTDGTEVPARLVLRDEDLDLAFLAPTTPLDEAAKAKIAVVPTEKNTTPVKLLDPIIEIGRHGKAMNYQSFLRLQRVTTILTSPRTLYIGSGGPGCPSFDGEGKFLGITTVYRKPGAVEAGHGGPVNASGTPAILPAADLADLISQAKEEMAKPPKEEPKEQPKSDKTDTQPAPTEPKESK